MSCPIYIIHMKRNPERRLYMQRQLDAFGLDYSFVEVDVFDKYELESKAYRIRVARMLEIDEQALENKYATVIDFVKNRRGNKYHELALLAIGLSHIKVYNLMIENNHSMACILEDDAKLLPTFPEVLKTAPDLEWDILQFCHEPSYFLFAPFLIRHFSRIGFLKFPNLRLFFSKNYDEIDRRIIREYGFDNPKYSKLAAYMKKTMQLYRNRHKSIIKSLIPEIIISIVVPGIIRKFLVPKSRSPQINNIGQTIGLLKLNTIIELGMFPEEPDSALITKHHCIAKPRGGVVSTTAYLLRQSAIAKWKQELLSENPLGVDQIPWWLHKNGQAKLRIISPPCATATYGYLKYTMRRSDIHFAINKTNF